MLLFGDYEAVGVDRDNPERASAACGRVVIGETNMGRLAARRAIIGARADSPHGQVLSDVEFGTPPRRRKPNARATENAMFRIVLFMDMDPPSDQFPFP